MNNEVRKLPTMQELQSETEMDLKGNAFMVLVNQPPPDSWLATHPMIQGYRYLPIERVEYLLTKVFGDWSVEIRDSKVIANSMVVVVRLHVTHPITKKEIWQDGIGAAPIQTDKGAGAMDWNAAKSDGVQKSAPSAETYAIKDAAEKFGKIFGKDVSRKNQMDYTGLLKQPVIKPESNERHGQNID